MFGPKLLSNLTYFSLILSQFTYFTYFYLNFPKITYIIEQYSNLLPNLNYRTFYRTFFAVISELRKFRLLPKNFRTSKTEHFRNSRKRKVRKFPSNAGPQSVCLFVGVNFINILRAAFTRTDPKSIKDTDNLTELLCFWELRV